MNTINTLLKNLTNTDENNKEDGKNNKTVNNCSQLPSLSQGSKFKAYQQKIVENVGDKNILEKIVEGFSSSKKDDGNKSLREEYEKTLNEYKKLLDDISSSVSGNIQRVNVNNPYLNKYIRFKTGEIYYVNKKGVAKKVKNNSILNSIAGKNGCPDKNFTDIDIPWNYNYNIPGQILPTNPPLVIGTEMKQNQSCGFEGSNLYVNSMINNPKITYKGCYLEQDNNPNMTLVGDGNYSFEDCQEYAIDQGFQFFALQNVNKDTGLGHCAVSNDFNKSTKLGKSYKFIPLWSSNTAGKPVSYATVTKNGTLSVCDTNGTPLFSTPNGIECGQVYSVSDNTDAPGNDLEYLTNQTVNSCKQMCNNNNSCTGFATDAENTSCWLKSGNLSNTINNEQRNLYKKTVNTKRCNYFLLLQNNGNMCILKEIYVNRRRNTRQIWCSNTVGTVQGSNLNYNFSKSKYGTDFLRDNQVLNKGDWVSSKNGKLLLIMQEDGNLVLYTFAENCDKNSNNQILGGALSNPIYDMGVKGNKNTMNSIGYIDYNSELHNYSSSNIKLSDTYSSVLENTNIIGNDILGAAYANIETPQDCMSKCNQLDECRGIVYDTTGQTPVCKLKNNNNFYSAGISEPKLDVTTYIRDKTIIKPPRGINNVINNTDTLTFNNYKKFSKNNNYNFDITRLTSIQKMQLEDLENRLDLLSEQLKGNTNIFTNLNNEFNLATQNRSKKFDKNLQNIQTVKEKIRKFDKSNNIDNILRQTEITTLQQNYSYMFWSIIAITTVLVALNIKK
jgi:hypothetical protein